MGQLADALMLFGSHSCLAHRVKKPKCVQKIVQHIVFDHQKLGSAGYKKDELSSH